MTLNCRAMCSLANANLHFDHPGCTMPPTTLLLSFASFAKYISIWVRGSESQSPCCRRFMGLALLELDRITTADRATPQHGGIDPDVDLIVLGRRAQDTRIPG